MSNCAKSFNLLCRVVAGGASVWPYGLPEKPADDAVFFQGSRCLNRRGAATAGNKVSFSSELPITLLNENKLGQKSTKTGMPICSIVTPRKVELSNIAAMHRPTIS